MLTFEDLKQVSVYSPAFRMVANTVTASNILDEDDAAWIDYHVQRYDHEYFEKQVELVRTGTAGWIDFEYMLSYMVRLSEVYPYLVPDESESIEKRVKEFETTRDFWEAYYRLFLFLRGRKDLGECGKYVNQIVEIEKTACKKLASGNQIAQPLTAFGRDGSDECLTLRVGVLREWLGVQTKEEKMELSELRKRTQETSPELFRKTEEWAMWLRSEAGLDDVLTAFVLDSKNVGLLSSEVCEKCKVKVMQLLSAYSVGSVKTRWFNEIVELLMTGMVIKADEEFRKLIETFNVCNEDTEGLEQKFASLLEHVEGK